MNCQRHAPRLSVVCGHNVLHKLSTNWFYIFFLFFQIPWQQLVSTNNQYRVYWKTFIRERHALFDRNGVPFRVKCILINNFQKYSKNAIMYNFSIFWKFWKLFIKIYFTLYSTPFSNECFSVYPVCHVSKTPS